MDTDKYLEVLPPQWKCHKLKDVSVFIKDGTHGTHPRQDSGIPLLSAKNITEQGQVYWDETDSFISDKEYGTICQSCKIQLNDLLLTIVGSLGRRALVINEQPFAVQRSVAIIRPDQNFVVPGFLYHVAGDDAFQRQLIVQSNATAQAGLYLEKLNNVKIIIPSLIREQELISVILDTIDEVIQRTEQLIAKLKAIKQGLLYDLFTRGLDENGQLRDPIAHSEQFKDSPLGKIPNEWDVYPINAIGKIVGGTTPSRVVPSYWGGIIPWITPTDMSKLRTDYISGGQDWLTQKGLDSCSAYLLPVGSIVVTTRATLGLAAITQRELATNQGFKNIITNDDWDNWFVCYKIRALSNEMVRRASGTTFLEISGTQFALL
jgi:type I restriction enzyme S subunit